MSISRWFTPTHLYGHWDDDQLTMQLTKYFCQFTKGEYTTPYWLELTWREKLLDLTWSIIWLDLKTSNDLTWLATQVLLTWLDLWLEQGWLVTTLSHPNPIMYFNATSKIQEYTFYAHNAFRVHHEKQAWSKWALHNMMEYLQDK